MKDNKKKLNNAVIEIEEVDFLITPEAALEIEEGKDIITLHRLVDNKDIDFLLKDVKNSISKGVTDYL